MTYMMRNVLEEFGKDLEGDEKVAFQNALTAYEFGSDKPDAVAYEGEFQRHLEQAGLAALCPRLVRGYHNAYLNLTTGGRNQ